MTITKNFDEHTQPPSLDDLWTTANDYGEVYIIPTIDRTSLYRVSIHLHENQRVIRGKPSDDIHRAMSNAIAMAKAAYDILT